jgi:hypothetical protein
VLYYISKEEENMFRIINKIRTLNHTSNKNGNHEKLIENILKSLSYKKTTIEKLGFKKQDIRETLKEKSKQKMWYVPQPCGTQSFPDFIVGDKFGNVFYVECKSAKQDHITWNSGMPKDNGIYVFSSGKHNAQTIVMGSDLWTKEEKDLQLKIRALIEKTYRPLKNNKHSVEYYGRHMHMDRSPVYGDKQRLKRESNVYRFIERRRKCQSS